MDDVCICTTESRPRVLHGPNGSRYGDELLDLVGICHSETCRGQGQLLGPSNPRVESRMGFKRRGSSRALGALGTRGHARQVDSGDTWTVSDILRCIWITMKCIFVYVTPNSDLGAICISCDLVAISHASSWFMWVQIMNAKSTRDRYDITRDK